ncbi:MAG TPA: hypothetical protein VN282_19125 [Pyrinomonadaceae bacterium]|nr:hypothetical protein [Pyrinomonadaceae bacterium]
MSDSVERPVFSEGQVLGAADLNLAVEHGRGVAARHERYLHTWGIAWGLGLTTKDKEVEVSGAPVKYVEVTLSPGVAIDGRGREIVVPEKRRLSEDDFDQLNVAVQDADALYPVYLRGLDEAGPAPAFSTGDCASAQSTRTVEGYDVSFGGPELTDLDDQAGAEVSDGPDSAGGEEDAWLVLLGFVKWDKAINKFTAVEVTALGVGPRYAGVLADVVAARNGKLLLRTRASNQSDKPALVIDEEEGGSLKFGLLNASGVVTPVLTVTASGDVTATGKIQGAFDPGSVYVQSGVASDGMIVPLPAGVKADQVGPGKAALHIQVTPRLAGATPPSNSGVWGAFPLECSVDSERRVRCLVRWVNFGAAPPTDIQDLPGVCDYSVTVAVPASEGGTT